MKKVLEIEYAMEKAGATGLFKAQERVRFAGVLSRIHPGRHLCGQKCS